MIYVTRLNYSSVVLNCSLIEHVEATPDTVITLTTGQRITVRESPAEVIERVRSWQHSLLLPDHLSEPALGDTEFAVPGLTCAGERHGHERPGGHHHGGI